MPQLTRFLPAIFAAIALLGCLLPYGGADNSFLSQPGAMAKLGPTMSLYSVDMDTATLVGRIVFVIPVTAMFVFFSNLRGEIRRPVQTIVGVIWLAVTLFTPYLVMRAFISSNPAFMNMLSNMADLMSALTGGKHADLSEALSSPLPDDLGPGGWVLVFASVGMLASSFGWLRALDDMQANIIRPNGAVNKDLPSEKNDHGPSPSEDKPKEIAPAPQYVPMPLAEPTAQNRSKSRSLTIAATVLTTAVVTAIVVGAGTAIINAGGIQAFIANFDKAVHSTPDSSSTAQDETNPAANAGDGTNQGPTAGLDANTPARVDGTFCGRPSCGVQTRGATNAESCKLWDNSYNADIPPNVELGTLDHDITVSGQTLPTIRDAEDFWSNGLVPGNTCLCVSGEIDKAAAGYVFRMINGYASREDAACTAISLP